MVSKWRIRVLQEKIATLMTKARREHLGGAESKELETAIAEKRRLERKRKKQIAAKET